MHEKVTLLYGRQVLSLQIKRRTKDPRPIVPKLFLHVPVTDLTHPIGENEQQMKDNAFNNILA